MEFGDVSLAAAAGGVVVYAAREIMFRLSAKSKATSDSKNVIHIGDNGNGNGNGKLTKEDVRELLQSHQCVKHDDMVRQVVGGLAELKSTAEKTREDVGLVRQDMREVFGRLVAVEKSVAVLEVSEK